MVRPLLWKQHGRGSVDTPSRRWIPFLSQTCLVAACLLLELQRAVVVVQKLCSCCCWVREGPAVGAQENSLGLAGAVPPGNPDEEVRLAAASSAREAAEVELRVMQAQMAAAAERKRKCASS